MSGKREVSKLEADRIAEFLRAKGLAFRSLWWKKMKRGLTDAEYATLTKLADDYHDTESAS